MTYNTILPLDYSSFSGSGSDVRDESLSDKIVKIRFFLPYIFYNSAPDIFLQWARSIGINTAPYYTVAEESNMRDNILNHFGNSSDARQQINYTSSVEQNPDSSDSFNPGGFTRYTLELVNNSKLELVDESMRRFFYGDDITNHTYYRNRKLFILSAPSYSSQSRQQTHFVKQNNNDIGLGQLMTSLSSSFSDENLDLPEYNLALSNKDNLINPKYAPAGMTPFPIQAVRKFLIFNPSIDWLDTETYDYHKNNMSDLYLTDLTNNNLYTKLVEIVDIVYDEVEKFFMSAASARAIGGSIGSINSYFDGLLAALNRANRMLSDIIQQYLNSINFFKYVVPIEYEFNRIFTEYSFALDTNNKSAAERISAYDTLHNEDSFEESHAILQEIEEQKAAGGLLNDADVIEYLSNAILSGRIVYNTDFINKVSPTIPPANSGSTLDMWDMLYYLKKL